MVRYLNIYTNTGISQAVSINGDIHPQYDPATWGLHWNNGEAWLDHWHDNHHSSGHHDHAPDDHEHHHHGVGGHGHLGDDCLGSTSIYVNPFIVIRNRTVTKHFYIGSERVVTKMGDPYDELLQDDRGPLDELHDEEHGFDPAIETDVYFYHPDHLGNTGYVTQVFGEVSQHVEYFAFGETFLEEHNNTTDRTPYLFNAKELDEETGLYYYGARYYDPVVSNWLSVDPLAEMYANWSPYNFALNNPLRFVDPDGRSPNDFVKRADGSIYWDDNANNQATTKKGETYLGKTLNFKFNSYIDSELWDGPGGNIPTGDKLTSNFTLTASENESGEIIDVSSKYTINVGDTPVGKARNFYPGEGGRNNSQLLTKYKKNGEFSGFNLSFEQHASVSPIEEFGLNTMGYKIVDVAQKMEAIFNKSTGNLNISTSTGVFPSATLDVNNNQVMKYNQPSFLKTHSAGFKFYKVGGRLKGKRDFSYYPSKFYNRK